MMQLAKKIFFLFIVVFLAGALGFRGVEAREVQLLMALDVSGSMKVTDPLRLLPKSAQIMVELLDEKDSLGVLTFEDVTLTRLTCAPLSPSQRRKGFRDLKGLQPRGLYTDLYQVLAAALKCFGPPGQAKRALLLISDGQMDINPAKGNSKAFVERVHQEIIPAYKKAGISIYTVAFTKASDQTLLKALAEQTGGRFLLIPSAQDIHQAFTSFYEELKGPQVAPLVGNHFVIDPQVQEAILVATRSRQGKPIVLETPKGGKLGPASKGIRWFSAPTFDMVTLPHPEPGKWTVSGYKEGQGKIILMTDLKLELAHAPVQAGTDEALVAGALLTNKNQPVTSAEVLKQTTFTAELQKEGGKPVTLPLGAPGVEQKDNWPPGARVAQFPPFNSPGVWQLRIRALGKTFQRERNISLKVTSPWYQARLLEGRVPVQVEFLPHPDRKASHLAGWISLSSPSGGVAGKFVDLGPGKSFQFALPPDLSGSYQASWEFRGVTASGRPLALQPPPLRLNLHPGAPASVIGPKSTAAAPEKGTNDTASAPKKALPDPVLTPMKGAKTGAAVLSPEAAAIAAKRRKWLWITVMALAALVIILGTAVYLFWPQALRLFISRVSKKSIADIPAEEMDPEQLNLLLKAQVESLQKEKRKLLADMGEMRNRIDKLISEKEELEARLGEPSREYQQKSKVIKELEQRLEEAEKEAKSVQEEYMALYARSQQEKQTIRKG
ncbi:MAG: VWA domain-containing protein [Thermodesulfobacteriota bacterium]